MPVRVELEEEHESSKCDRHAPRLEFCVNRPGSAPDLHHKNSTRLQWQVCTAAQLNETDPEVLRIRVEAVVFDPTDNAGWGSAQVIDDGSLEVRAAG